MMDQADNRFRKKCASVSVSIAKHGMCGYFACVGKMRAMDEVWSSPERKLKR